MLQSSAAGLSVTASPPLILRPRGRGRFATSRAATAEPVISKLATASPPLILRPCGRGRFATSRAATAEPVISKRATAGFKLRGRGRSNVLRTQQPSETEKLCYIQPVGFGKGCAIIEGTLWETDLLKVEQVEKEWKNEEVRLEEERREKDKRKVEEVEEEREVEGKREALAEYMAKKERNLKKTLRQVLSIYVWLPGCCVYCLIAPPTNMQLPPKKKRFMFAFLIEARYQIQHGTRTLSMTSTLGHEVFMPAHVKPGGMATQNETEKLYHFMPPSARFF